MIKKGNLLTAIVAERIFGAVIMLLLIGLVVDFMLVTNFLKSESAKSEVLHKKAEASDKDLAKLKSADTWLKKNDEVVKRTDAIVAESKLYKYQNQIIEDLKSYGAKAGTHIVGYNFTAPTVAGTASTATPTTTTPPPTAAPTTPGVSSPGSSAAKTSPDVNSTTVSIEFADKVRYQSFLNLLRLLEQNVTRMQVTDVSLSPDTKQPKSLISPTITIIVYTR